MAEKSYIGRVGNTGPQMVKAPVSAGTKKGNGSVKKGEDLRSGKK